MRRPLLVGNWKLNGSRAQLLHFLDGLDKSAQRDLSQLDMGLCLPATYLHEASERIAESGLLLGAQNVSDKSGGSFTGEISAEVLREYKTTLSIVGFSERRLNYAESNDNVAQRCLQALNQNINPIFCVGDNKTQRKDSTSFQAIGDQLMPLLDDVPAEKLSEVIIAYEPLWFEQAGESVPPKEIQEMHEFIRAVFSDISENLAERIRIIYSASNISAENILDYLAESDIDGFLLNDSAAINAEAFIAIAAAAIN